MKLKSLTPTFLLFIFLLMMASTSAQDRLRRGQQAEIMAEFKNLRIKAENLQKSGADLSAAMPYFRHIRGAMKHQRIEAVRQLIDEVKIILDNLPRLPQSSNKATIKINASASGPMIPHLAGRVVLKSFHDDPTTKKYMQEIKLDSCVSSIKILAIITFKSMPGPWPMPIKKGDPVNLLGTIF